MRNKDEIIDNYLIEEYDGDVPQDELDDRAKAKRRALTLIRDIVIAFVVIVVILQFIRPTIVFEHSMEDTLHPEDYVFLARQAYLLSDVSFGDVVVCESVILDDRGVPKNLIKRVIGLPDDIIAVRDGAVYRNGERLDEPYTKDGYTEGEMASVTVPQGTYFLLGDNRQVSKDSRDAEIGFVEEDKIKGKVFFRLFPISSIGIVR
ncbi:MAG: signal peptidase I [Clostridiales bacterium]|nr:signal peptidase I [Clostridiales bacterium]